MSEYQVFLLWYVGWPVAGVVVGFLGRRFVKVRWVLAGAGAAYSILFLAYFLFRGGPNDCVSTGGSSYACHPTSFMSNLDAYGVFVVLVVTLLMLAPLVSAWAGVRWPSIAAVVALVFLYSLYTYGLLVWLPAASAVMGAAIAGPPRRHRPAVPAEVSRS